MPHSEPSRATRAAPLPRTAIVTDAGGEAANAVIARLCAKHDGVLRRHAPRLVPACDIDDLVADTYLKVHSALRNGRGPTDDGVGYLITTMRSVAITKQRRLARAVEVQLHDGFDTADHRAEHAVPDTDLVAALADLSDDQRRILWATAVEGRTPRELAGPLGISPEAVAASSYRARQALRRALLERTAAVPA